MTSSQLKEQFKRDGWLVALATVAIAFYFWRFSRFGLRAGFTYDDLMNCGRAVRDSYWVTFRDIFCFWRYADSFRPFGSLFYRVIVDLFGFEPFPFRVASHLVMALNLFLAYRFFRLISQSREIALLAVLIFAYRPNWTDLYSNTGYCYDILCFSLYFGALYVYLRARLQHRQLSNREIAAFVGLVWVGLSTKEMIVSVPVVVLLAELFWLDRSGSPLRRFGPALATGAMVALFVKGRLFAPQGLGALPGYKTEYTLRTFLERAGYFLTQFLSLPEEAAGFTLAAVFLIVLGAALASGQIGPRVCSAIAVIGILPVAFIEGRGLAQVYIAASAAAFLMAWVLVEISQPLFRFRWRPVALFVVVLALQLRTAKALPPNVPVFFSRGGEIQKVIASARALNLRPPRGSRILMRDDPFPTFRWASTFLVWILYRDATISVDWASELPPGTAPPKYYTVLTTRNGALERVW